VKRVGSMNSNKGFSLIEILIVLGLIAGIVAFIATRISGAQGNAQVKTTKLGIQNVIDQLELYNTDCQSYPSSTQGLMALVKKPSGEPACESWGPNPYAKDTPRDAWGQPFVYESDGIEYEIISYGKNKRPGGDGVDADISSKTMKLK
jgi:general secretion pathway protein G